MIESNVSFQPMMQAIFFYFIFLDKVADPAHVSRRAFAAGF
jgi:hypothetical protein